MVLDCRTRHYFCNQVFVSYRIYAFVWQVSLGLFVLSNVTSTAEADIRISTAGGVGLGDSIYIVRASAARPLKKLRLESGLSLIPLWEVSVTTWQPISGQDGDGNGMISGSLRLLMQIPLTARERTFIEFGTGPMVISKREVADELDWGSNLQFDSHIGFGTFLDKEKRFHVVYRLQHASNASISDINPGLNFHMIQLGIRY